MAGLVVTLPLHSRFEGITMGQLHTLWKKGKDTLTKDQQAKLPKDDFGKMCDTFETTCSTAIKKLQEANNALWAVFVDGEDEKGDKSVRKILEKYTQEANKDKAIGKALAQTIVDVDRMKAGFLKKVMTEFAKIKVTAENLKKYSGN
jgi:hypothetical protein